MFNTRRALLVDVLHNLRKKIQGSFRLGARVETHDQGQSTLLKCCGKRSDMVLV